MTPARPVSTAHRTAVAIRADSESSKERRSSRRTRTGTTLASGATP
jgi:hypothetical protein